LRLASFWGVTSDEQTKEHLKNTAWWLAVGWPWSDIEKLAHDGKARSDRLKQSLGFQHDIGDATRSLSRSSPGSLDYALALSDMAFTYAIWGIDLTGPGYTSDPCAAQGVPENGRRAAEQAVCIVGKLKHRRGEKRIVYGLAVEHTGYVGLSYHGERRHGGGVESVRGARRRRSQIS